MSNKKQFLDPIGTCCKIVLLCFSPPGTKLRVINHKIELTNNNVWENVVVRQWFKDSRNDLCVIFPVIVRFIEGYLCTSNRQSESDNGSGSDDDNDSCDDITNNETYNTQECIESLRDLGRFAQKGLCSLSETYGYDNTAFVLQYYANLINEGINERYNSQLLPKHLTNITNTLLNENRIKRLWSNEEIIFVCNTFKSWFLAVQTSNPVLANAHRASICELLDTKDTIFLNSVTQSTLT